jgi:nickel/cobalt transporter (NicO) family protein
MPVRRITVLMTVAVLLAAAGTAFAATSSLGIGTNEVSVQPTGLFAGLFHWINAQQKEFYRAMTGALKAMRDDGSKAWLLVGLSFVYGVLHAAGPGHGKAVISSYMVANEVTLRRGIILSFISAFLQALSALVIVGLAFLVLRGTTISMDDATQAFEVASFALITAFGAWLLWTETMGRGLGHAQAHAGHDHSKHSHSQHSHNHTPHANAHHGHSHDAHDVHDLHKAHAHDEVCDTCGHAHAPDPQLIAKDFSWKTASSAVLAVGLRPCSGALIVLTFAILNGLYVGGVMSVMAMALGTAITVSALATLAVMAKNVALRLTKPSSTDGLHRIIEIGGAALVFLLGLTLLTASLSP